MLRTLKTVMRQDKEKFKIPKSVHKNTKNRHAAGQGEV